MANEPTANNSGAGVVGALLTIWYWFLAGIGLHLGWGAVSLIAEWIVKMARG